MNRIRLGIVAIAESAVSGMVPSTGQASASTCQVFPKVSVWGDYAHAKVKGIVADRLEGDWDTYLDYLGKRLKLITDAERHGKTLAIQFDGVRCLDSGEELKHYVRAAEARQRVARCLAEEAAAEKLQQFATAAGPGVTANDSTPFTEVASAAIAGDGATAALLKRDGFDLSLVTACVGGNATFKFTNRSETWPMRGTISIYRLGKGEPLEVQARSLRFNGGRTVTLNIPAAKNPTGQLGAFINPSWVKRPLAFDRVLDCR